jgi:hypothetical protein
VSKLGAGSSRRLDMSTPPVAYAPIKCDCISRNTHLLVVSLKMSILAYVDWNIREAFRLSVQVARSGYDEPDRHHDFAKRIAEAASVNAHLWAELDAEVEAALSAEDDR